MSGFNGRSFAGITGLGWEGFTTCARSFDSEWPAWEGLEPMGVL